MLLLGFRCDYSYGFSSGYDYVGMALALAMTMITLPIYNMDILMCTVASDNVKNKLRPDGRIKIPKEVGDIGVGEVGPGSSWKTMRGGHKRKQVPDYIGAISNGERVQCSTKVHLHLSQNGYEGYEFTGLDSGSAVHENGLGGPRKWFSSAVHENGLRRVHENGLRFTKMGCGRARAGLRAQGEGVRL